MRLLFPLALYIVAACQQNPDPWDQPQVNRYRDSACAEVRGLKDADCHNLPEVKPVPHESIAEVRAENARLTKMNAAYEKETQRLQTAVDSLNAENARLKTGLAAANEATADSQKQIAELKKNLVEMHDGAVGAPHFGDQKWPE